MVVLLVLDLRLQKTASPEGLPFILIIIGWHLSSQFSFNSLSDHMSLIKLKLSSKDHKNRFPNVKWTVIMKLNKEPKHLT